MLVGEPATLGIYHLGPGSDPLVNALQNAHAMQRVPAVSAKMQAIGVRPNHRNRLQLVQIKRQQVFVILQQNDRFLRGFERHLAMLWTVGDALSLIRIDKRIVEQSEPELRRQNS